MPLAVTTARQFDWPEAAATLLARGVVVVVLHAQDPVRDLEQLRAAEAESCAGDAERSAAWQDLRTLPYELQLRDLLPLLDGVLHGDLQDPRLQTVAAIVAAERAFWRAVAPATCLPGWPDQRAIALSPLHAPLLATRRVLAAHAFDQVRTLCREVERHAATTAARTRDAAMAARYRVLAERCAEIVRSIGKILAA